TPFRRDKKEINANHIYNYPLSQAYRDGVFGELKYVPVHADSSLDSDVALAKKGEEIFLRDVQSGYDHSLMVRCSSKKEAERLFEKYKENTQLRLEIVDSSKSRNVVLNTIRKLRTKEIDGVVCVDMMAEGFDFPNLKIAVIHQPHKSLATTLQFIGRFARTTSDVSIGEATFIALKDEEFMLENKQLFASDSIWQDIIIDLSEEKISRDIEEQNYMKSFDNHLVTTNTQDFSLHSIQTNFHAKVYYTTLFNLEAKFPDIGLKIENININREDNTVVIVASSRKLPRWSTNDGVYYDIEYNSFIVHYQQKNGLLFINSHIKSESVYDAIASAFCGENNYQKIRMSSIHRVLSGLQNHEIFNSGMANRLSEGESYKISSGSDVSKTIDAESGRMYSPGHVFCKAEGLETSSTIGYSSGAKIWSSTYGNIQEMVKWFDINGDKIVNKSALVKTNTNYDFLPMWEELIEFPENIFMWDFCEDSYLHHHHLADSEGNRKIESILDVEIAIESIEATQILLRVQGLGFSYLINRLLSGEYVSLMEEEIFVACGRDLVPLSKYLNDFPLYFYTSNFDLIEGPEINRINLEIPAFNSNKIVKIDWGKYKTDISMEFKKSSYNGDENSIQDTIGEILLNENEYDYVIFDHTTGEIADYIAIKFSNEEISIWLFHAKGKSAVQFNSSVGDVYEVMGQSVKSLIWLKSKGVFLSKLRDRQKRGHGNFIKGNIEKLTEDLKKNIPIRGKIVACQPGITSSSNLPDKVSEVLSAADMKIRNSAVANEFIVWGS
ncbi:helicase-related protein, partial [Carnobacterium sp.]|uniref:DEAD/DEAH box helicase n=1 Tax=Carnobacterium sp. TaxID=48221 RepID=UPI0028ABB039